MSEDLDPESPGGLGPGVDPEDLATTLRVLGTLHELPAGHPDIAAVKRASGTMYNRVRKAARRAARRAERDPMIARDEAILAFSGAESQVNVPVVSPDDEQPVFLTRTQPCSPGSGGTLAA